MKPYKIFIAATIVAGLLMTSLSALPVHNIAYAAEQQKQGGEVR